MGAPVEGAKEKMPPARPPARVLTITIVLATFIAALGGFLLNHAAAAAANAGDLAQTLSLRGSAAETSASHQAETDYAQYLALQSLEAKAAQEMIEATYRQPGAQAWADLYKVSTAQVARTATAIPHDLRPYLANGNPDLSFPYDFFVQRASSGTYLQAKSDAYNDVSARWTKLVDSYTAMLTMVAVALFLFGSAYVLYGRNRLIFTSLGIALLATSLIWGAALELLRQPGTPSAVAATDYARGVTAMAEAVTPAGYQPAIANFTAAIKLRPDYALAYSERGVAEALRGSEAIGAGFISYVSAHWARLSAADEQKAYALGNHNANQVLTLGYGYYSLWILGGGVGQPPVQAVDFFRQAAHLDPADATPLLDLGIAELASGDYTGAKQAYSAGITHMLFTCSRPAILSTCTQRQPGTSYGLQQAWLAGAMESLEALAQSRAGASSPKLVSVMSEMKGMLTTSMASGQLEASSAVRSGFKEAALSGFVDPNWLGLYVPVAAGLTHQQMADMPLTVLWYERRVGTTRWSAIPETACWGDGRQLCGAYYAPVRSFEFSTRFLAADNNCFTNLQYRAELYVGGSLEGSLALGPRDDYIATNLRPALAKTMNLGICVPSSWKLQPAQTVTLPVWGSSGTVTGPLSTAEMSYASPGGSQGVYLFRLYPPRTSATGALETVPQLVQDGERYAINLLKGRALPADIAPAEPPAPDPIWGYPTAGQVINGYVSPSSPTQAFVGAAVIAPGGAVPTAPAQDGQMAARVAGDYAIVVTVVYGPKMSGMWSGSHSLGLQIFSSWSSLNYG